MLIFDGSSEDVCNSKAFVDIATAGGHRGLITIYRKNCLFHQSKLGRDFEPLSSRTSTMFSSNPKEFIRFLCECIVHSGEFRRMKASARSKNDIWCKDLAYVDKLAKDNNGVKHVLVRQDLFDRNVDARGMKTKNSKGWVRAFLTMITKEIDPRNFGLTKEQNLLESLKNYGKLKEYKVTLQWVRPRLHLLKAQYNHWKLYFTATGKVMDTSTFTNWLNSLQHWTLDGIAR